MAGREKKELSQIESVREEPGPEAIAGFEIFAFLLLYEPMTKFSYFVIDRLFNVNFLRCLP